MEEKYITISMEDSRIKEFSEALSNPSCKKILSLLSEKELTETEIAKELKVPLNTVGYNIKKLISAGLIEKANYFWSVRGKKMPVYKTSNKKIIISPKKRISLSALLFSFIGTSLLAFAMKTYTPSKKIEEVDFSMASESFLKTSMAVEEGGSFASNFVTGLMPWQWFLIGSWLGIIIFFIFILINERRKNE